MTPFVLSEVCGRIGCITLDRPKALNSLSLEMVRSLHTTLQVWRNDDKIDAVLIKSSNGRAFCAGGDIRFFYEAGHATPMAGSALLEDFFTEEYALNHLIHFYPKPYIALMDGVVMGGGMGIAQAGPEARLRIVTERTKMAMPEVNIGLFPDVGGSYFLTRAPQQLGTYLAISGETIAASDALFANLADVFVPSTELPALIDYICQQSAANGQDIRQLVRNFAAPFAAQALPEKSLLAEHASRIEQVFSQTSIARIINALVQDGSRFALQTLHAINQRSPLMMSVTLEQLRRGREMSVAECLRMERSMVRHNFTHGEVLEGVRALVIDKDNTPRWNPNNLADIDQAMIARFFVSAWPAHAHPLRHLD
mgnify:CR=1 FL=1